MRDDIKLGHWWYLKTRECLPPQPSEQEKASEPRPESDVSTAEQRTFVPRTQDALTVCGGALQPLFSFITQRRSTILIDPGEALQELPLIKVSNGGHSLY